MYAFTVSKMFSAQIPPKWCISATISTKYTDIRKGAVAEARLHAFGLSRDRVLKEGTLAGTDLLRISGTILRWIDKGDEMENKRCYKRDNYRYKHYYWPRRKTKQKQKNVEVILRYLLPPFSTTNQRNITFPPHYPNKCSNSEELLLCMVSSPGCISERSSSMSVFALRAQSFVLSPSWTQSRAAALSGCKGRGRNKAHINLLLLWCRDLQDEWWGRLMYWCLFSLTLWHRSFKGLPASDKYFRWEEQKHKSAGSLS